MIQLYNLTPAQLTQAYKNAGGVTTSKIVGRRDVRLLSSTAIRVAGIGKVTEAFIYEVLWQGTGDQVSVGNLIVYMDPKTLQVMGLT